jgi:MFS family permease
MSFGGDIILCDCCQLSLHNCWPDPPVRPNSIQPGVSIVNYFSMKPEIDKTYRFNFIVNVMDGGFFGSAIGFASFITVIPLFVDTMTDSALLIGLIPAIHSVGWQLPQLFTANRVARLRRYKPMVLFMTIHERLPFFGLGLVAWFLPSLGPRTGLWLTFGLLIWQGLGGGFTATAWQAMIAKIIPVDRHGTFFGFQSAFANLFASGSGVLAGLLLERLDLPLNYTLCFALAGLAMAFSYFFLALTREPLSPVEEVSSPAKDFYRSLTSILKRDTRFRWFLVVRGLSQFSVVAFSFYTVYAVRYMGMNEATAGLMMGVYTFGQIAANPLMGWIGDRWSYPFVMTIGVLAATMSAVVAITAPQLNWFYLAFILAGVANVSIWTIGLAMTLQFGSLAERPAYIGLANTLVAPVTILAPLFGGWLADYGGFEYTFILSAVCGLITAIVLWVTLRSPRNTFQETAVHATED